MVAGSVRRAPDGLRARAQPVALLARLVVALLVIATPVAAMGAIVPDDAREDRWAQEIVPAIIVGDPVYLATPSRSRVLALFAKPSGGVAAARGGVILVHGLGVNPDWGLIGALRAGLADAGLETLSVQMPVLAPDAPATDYAALFGASSERLAAALTFLRGHGVDRIAIVSHSLGSAMTDAFLAANPAPRVAAWVTIGMQGGFSALTREPVLDVTAENDLPQVRAGIARRASDLPHDGCSRHIVIAGADHFMERRYNALLAAIEPFLARALSGQC